MACSVEAIQQHSKHSKKLCVESSELRWLFVYLKHKERLLLFRSSKSEQLEDDNLDSRFVNGPLNLGNILTLPVFKWYL